MNFIELIIVVICGVLFSSKQYSNVEKHNIRWFYTFFATLLLVIIFLALQNNTSTGTHIFVVFILLGTIGQYLEKKTQPPQQPLPPRQPKNQQLVNNKISRSSLRKKTQSSNLYHESISDSDLNYISFSYVDSAGNFSFREVDVKKVDENYITGFCYMRRKLRTFRLDRIENDEVIIRQSGEILNVHDWIIQLFPLPKE